MWTRHQQEPSCSAIVVFLSIMPWYLMADLVRTQSSVVSMTHRASKKPINVVLLVPKNNKYMFSYAHVYPAMDIAIKKLGLQERLLPDHYFKVRYNDTKCHEAMGMNLAIQYYFHKQVDVFFGPVCDYVIAPVLRQLTFWNLPMITPGANAWGFVKDRKSMFPMLTRVGPVSHYSLVNFFVDQVVRYNWQKVKVVS
ncbi:unnamed protein product [Candidula unifasciata]|uniref:Receptor ligand binding region domain-containing protein n=1 Tax=Candidula unifasciata TaxID=100452 RepID=A0A8S3ZEJ0_9EUPU|nr:unnamed protein product [Candidula unifasciata]